MNIVIAGFPYIRESYRDTFKKYPADDRLFFLLPKRWAIKNGAVVFKAPHEAGVYRAKAFFQHSHYPLLGGIFKGWMPAFPFKLWHIKKTQGVDLVYSCSEPILLTTLYQALWSKILGCRHVFFSWENISYQNKFSGLNLLIKELILKLNIALSEGIICGNKKGEEIFKQYTSRIPVKVIPMSGVNSELFQRTLAPKVFQGHSFENKVVFTFAGALGRRKGLDFLVEAFAKLHKENPNTVLVIAGSGEYESQLNQKISENNLPVARFAWLNSSELKDLLNVSDVFVYPSISENGWEEQFGYSMAEASLMELPVISTTSGSIGDVVRSGETGILIPEKNSEALYRAMAELAADPEKRTRMGSEGRTFMLKEYDYSAVSRHFYNFFHSLN